MIFIASLTSENSPFFKQIHFILFAMSPYFHLLMPIKLLQCIKLLQSKDVLLLFPLSIYSVRIPLNNLPRQTGRLNSVNVQPIVNISIFLSNLKFILEGFVVIRPPVLGKDLIIELCSCPDAEFCSLWNNTESLADISDCPSLKITFVNSVHGLG